MNTRQAGRQAGSSLFTWWVGGMHEEGRERKGIDRNRAPLLPFSLACVVCNTQSQTHLLHIQSQCSVQLLPTIMATYPSIDPAPRGGLKVTSLYLYINVHLFYFSISTIQFVKLPTAITAQGGKLLLIKGSLRISNQIVTR